MQTSESKRSFLKKSLALGLGLPLLSTELIAGESTPAPLNILILGGTSFLGPHQVAYAISRGHKVSTFTRGKTKPTVHAAVFDQVEMLIGDRIDNLSALEGRKWDVVIDNSGRAADWTKRSAELLKGQVGQYIYISSTGVYYPHLEANVDENTSVLLEDPKDENGKAPERDSFGVMKAKSELEAIGVFGKDRTTIVRPTYMMGPADRTDRFMHWPLRLQKGGEVMVPGKEKDPVQYIDVRDVAEWVIRLAETKTAGTFNAVGPAKSQSILQYVKEAATAFDAKSKPILINDYDFLKEHNLFYIIPWIMPNDDYYASARVQNSKALAAGLTLRSLPESTRDIYDWWHSEAVTEERRKKYADSPQNMMTREAAILEAYKNRTH